MTDLQDLVTLEDARDEKTAEEKQGDPDVLLQLLQDLEPSCQEEQVCPL